MSKAEKIVRLIIVLIAMVLITTCFSIVIEHIQIENEALKHFMHIAFPASMGFLCGNHINNMLNLPEKGGK